MQMNIAVKDIEYLSLTAQTADKARADGVW